MYRVMRSVGLAAVAALGMVSASCAGGGGERIEETGATLEGTVKYGNEPVHAAMIIVTGGKGMATGNVDEATGRYKVVNVPLGTVNIGVNTAAAKGQLMGKMMSGYYQGPEAKAKGRVTPPKVVDIPDKYTSPETSGISTTVQKGENTFDITVPK